jgi:uncharacterized protein (DUF488 family)
MDRLPKRQVVLLQLLRALGGSAKRLDFQKILFLYCQEPNTGRPYDFVPFEFGAFSFTSDSDRRKLLAMGLLDADEEEWKLSALAWEHFDPEPQVTGFVDALAFRSGDPLVAETYRRFPYYAMRSEIADIVLKEDKAALQRIEAERNNTRSQSLQTIGYEGRTLETYLNILLLAGVSILCDVRRNPVSRKYGFAKSTLSQACKGVGIRYEHMPELGIHSDQRRNLDSQEDYDALFEVYEREWLPEKGEALNTVHQWIEAGERVALTCYEKLPEQCHRHCVAEALEARLRPGVRAVHL